MLDLADELASIRNALLERGIEFALKRLRAGAYDLVDIDRLPAEDVDASDRAIFLRMRRVAQLRNLCLSLGKAGAEASRVRPSIF